MKLNDIKNGLSWFLNEQQTQLITDPINCEGHPLAQQRGHIISKQLIKKTFRTQAQEIAKAKRLEAKFKRDGWLPLSQRTQLNKLRKIYKKGSRYITPNKQAICPASKRAVNFSSLKMRDAKKVMNIFLTAAHEAILENESLFRSQDKSVRLIKKYFKDLSFAKRREAYNQLSDYRAGSYTGLTKSQQQFLNSYLRLHRNESRRAA